MLERTDGESHNILYEQTAPSLKELVFEDLSVGSHTTTLWMIHLIPPLFLPWYGRNSDVLLQISYDTLLEENKGQ